MNRALLALLLLLACGDVDAQSIGGGAVGGGGGGAAADPTPVFDFDPGVHGSGPAQLTDAPTFGGTSMTEVVDCDARTFTAGFTWPCATGGTWTMPSQEPTKGYYAPFTENGGRSNTFDGDSFAAPVTTTAEIATEDFLSTIVFHAKADSAAQYVFGKYDLAGALGWAIRITAGNSLEVVVNATSTGAYTYDTFGEWNIVTLACMHDGSANSLRMYVNGALTGAAGVCPAATSAAPTKHVEMGGRSDADADEMDDGMVSNAWVWTCADCMTTTADIDAVVLEQHARLFGVYLDSGSAPRPTAMTRTSPAYMQTMVGGAELLGNPVSPMFRVGAGWPRVERWEESQIDGGRVVGYNAEPQVTNLALQSIAFDNASWTELTVADSTTANVTEALNQIAVTASPLQSFKEADRLVLAASGAVEHGYRQAVTLTAKEYVISVYTAWRTADSITTPYAWLRDNTIGATAVAWFDARTCEVVGDVGAGLHAFTTGARGAAHSVGYGVDANSYQWCRHWIVVDGTAALHDIDIGVSSTDSATTHSAAGAENALIFWGAQVEGVFQALAAAQPPSMPIPTDGTSKTRNSDSLKYSYTMYPALGGTLLASFLMRDLGVVGSATGVVASAAPCLIEKNASNYIEMEVTGEAQSGNQYGTAWDINTAGVGQIAGYAGLGGYSLRNGRRHEFRGVFMPNDARFYMDDNPSSLVTDTSVTLPTIDSGSITIGHVAFASTHYMHGIVERCRIYPGDVTPSDYP